MRITTGNPGERPVFERESQGFLVRQMPDDAKALRISIGQTLGDVPESYLVFRGDRKRITDLLRRAVTALEQA